MNDDVILLAGCVLLDPYGRVLLLHRGGEEYGRWELPGGKVEEDETPVMAAIREIQEELGVNVDIARSLGSEVFEDGDKTYKFHWFQAVIKDGVPDVMEADTFDDLDYFDIEDFASLALSANMLVLHEKLLSGEVVLEQ
jgi:8-oxo-dGTP pyrophosphatase MutT (NUDIX family)